MTEWTNLDERILLDGLWGLLPKNANTWFGNGCEARLLSWGNSQLFTIPIYAHFQVVLFCFSHAVMNRVSIVSI